jgi:hypothetical protein
MNLNDINQQVTEVDKLGAILAAIADLEKQATTIKDDLKDRATAMGGDNIYEGLLFKATIVESNRKTVDYKKLLADLGVDEATIAAYTSVSAVFAVKVTSR